MDKKRANDNKPKTNEPKVDKSQQKPITNEPKVNDNKPNLNAPKANTGNKPSKEEILSKVETLSGFIKYLLMVDEKDRVDEIKDSILPLTKRLASHFESFNTIFKDDVIKDTSIYEKQQKAFISFIFGKLNGNWAKSEKVAFMKVTETFYKHYKNEGFNKDKLFRGVGKVSNDIPTFHRLMVAKINNDESIDLNHVNSLTLSTEGKSVLLGYLR